MTTGRESVRQTPGGVHVDWQSVYEQLKAGQYEQVAETLLEAELAWEQRDEAILVQLLAMACRICLACSQCRAEVEWHRRARQEAGQRERELRQQLLTTIKLISEFETSEFSVRRHDPDRISGTETPLLDHGTLEPSEPPSFWQRVRALFRRGTPPLSSKHKSPGAPEEPIASSPVSEAAKSLASRDTAEQRPRLPDLEDDKAPAPSSAREEGALPPRPARAMAKPRVSTDEERVSPSLVVYCLGSFRVYQDDQPVEEWPSSKGKAIFKYLVAHRERPVPKEVLMELFWPGSDPDAARNNLNVAIYGLRQALRKARPSYSHVLFRDDCYLLNPDLPIWLDCDAFSKHLTAAQDLMRHGNQVEAIREYRAAEVIYEGEFLEEDRYEDWLLPQRQRLQEDYLSLLDCLSRYCFDQGDDMPCVSVCRKMLAVDPCREEAHRRLMRCYSRQQQPYLALRQYHQCVEALKKELEAIPTSATTELYEHIRRHQQV